MSIFSGGASGTDVDSQYGSSSSQGYNYGQNVDPFSQGMMQNMWDQVAGVLVQDNVLMQPGMLLTLTGSQQLGEVISKIRGIKAKAK
jgi:hypothetical protein